MPLTVGNCFTAFFALLVGMAVALLLFCAEFTTAKAGIRPTLLDCYGNPTQVPLERAIERWMNQYQKRFLKAGMRRRKIHKRWRSAEDIHLDKNYYSNLDSTHY